MVPVARRQPNMKKPLPSRLSPDYRGWMIHRALVSQSAEEVLDLVLSETDTDTDCRNERKRGREQKPTKPIDDFPESYLLKKNQVYTQRQKSKC